MKIASLLLVLISFSLAGWQPATLKNTQQLIVVTTADWQANHGTLQRYEKKLKKWSKVGKSLKVKVGKNGLGWGRGVHSIPRGAKVIKREGDGKAPAGIFRLKNAFGYKPYSISYPYHVSTASDHCVDDGKSRWYNQVIDSKKYTKDYSSFERMRLKSNLYKYGLIVDHNPTSKAGAGSCIFMHIKKSNGKATVGCTAMSESEIKTLLKWLNPKKHPLLMQAPESEMKRLIPWR